MNKDMTCFLFVMLAFVLASTSAFAITIPSGGVNVTDKDIFYSGYAPNSVIHLRVNLTDINSTIGNVVTVVADLVDLNVDCGNGIGSKVELASTPVYGIYEGTCDVSQEAGSMSANAVKPGKVIVIANETFGQSSANTDLLVALYNIEVPAGIKNPITPNKECYRFSSVGSTKFNEVENFNDMDITLVIEANGEYSCFTSGLINGYSWDGWMPVAKLNFNEINFNNNYADMAKLVNLSSIVSIRYSSSKTYQNTRFSVDTAKLPELDTNPFNVWLYHLAFTNPTNAFINSDNNVVAETVDWASNGYDSILDANTYNLTFTLNKGFKGFNITDNSVPAATLYSPQNGLVTNASSIQINYSVNGTGTPVSKVVVYVNNVSTYIFNGTTNTANCTAQGNGELYNCVFTIAKPDGVYNVTIQSYDFGRSSGNSITTNLQYYVQTSAPSLKILSPKKDAKYEDSLGSMLNLTFNVTDGNGISSCWYSLDGETKASNVNIRNCTSGSNNLPLYLETGEYELTLSANDSLGLASSGTVSFEVADDAAPKILNNTIKITKNNALLTIVTDESAKCRYDSQDDTFTDLKDDFNSNITIHTANIDVSGRNSDDADLSDYTYYIRCSDLSGNSNKNSLVLNLVNQSAANATQNQTKPQVTSDPTEEFDLGLLLAGRKIIDIENSRIPFTDILLTTDSASDDVFIRVVSLSNSSIRNSEKTYAYVSIDHSGIKDSIIEGAVIRFEVSKEWLSDNDINGSDIVLYRYDGEWKSLNTSITSQNANNVVYTAMSPGLSLFSISKAHAIAAINTTKENVTENVSVTTAPIQTQDETRGKFNWIWVIVGIVVFVIVLLFILVERNERSGPMPIFPQDRTLWNRIKRIFR